MKKYWVIGYDTYYPSGGLGDVKATFETLEEAEEYAETITFDNVEVEDVSSYLT